MIASTIFKTLSIAVFLVSSAQAGPLSSRGGASDLPEGYTEVPVEWELQSHPNGDIFTMNGTVEQVHEELTKRNPHYRRDFKLDEDEDEDENPLVRRDKCDDDWTRIKCDISRTNANKGAIKDGIKHLRKAPGRPSLPGGPGRCGRVSCSHDSGIWWCNDSKDRKTLGSYNSIANGAQCIINECNGILGATRGQSFTDKSWTVMVHRPNGFC